MDYTPGIIIPTLGFFRRDSVLEVGTVSFP